MKVKSFIAAGMIAAVVSPVMADGDEFKVSVDKDGKILMDADSAKFAQMLEKYNNALKLSGEIQKTRAQCISKKDFWYDGKCVPKNPCTSKDAADKKFCVTAFKNVQVATPEDGGRIVMAYVKNVMKWEGCAGGLKVPKSKASGQDYIECINPADGEPRVFEFDDLSETSNKLASSNRAYGMCIALKGKAAFPKRNATEVVCSGISAKVCEDSLWGAFESGKCTVKM